MLLNRSFTFAAIAQQFSTIAQTAQIEPNSRSSGLDGYQSPVGSPYASSLPMPYAAADQQTNRFGR